MEAIINFFTGTLNTVAWLYIFLPCTIIGGLYLTIRNRGIQFTRFGYAMKNTVGKMFQKQEAGAGAVTPLQAVTTALAATVGTGNIVGTSQAIALGGYGAVFWLWLAALLVIIGRTTAFIIDLRDASLATELWLAFAALAICLGQFKVGRMLGRRYGDAPAGGQSLGQKNTVLAVWMAQSFLDPISSIAPTAYIVWQNFVNSYQIYKKDRETTKNQI